VSFSLPRPYPFQAATTWAAIELLKGGGSVLIQSPTGCHRAGQGILMFDGSVKPVEDVVVGDVLMGPDSTPRRVLALFRGQDQMFRVVPIKGAPFVVNGDHVLSLRETESGDIVDVSVRDYLGWSKWRKHIHKLFRVGVEFWARGEQPVDPYFLGVLLGDGCLRGTPCVCKPDPEIRSEVLKQAVTFDLQTKERGSGTSVCFCLSTGRRGAKNRLTEALKKLGLWGCDSGAKFVPQCYRIAGRDARLAALAGLLDTDGHLHCGGYDFVSKSKALASDVVFIARSLGLAAYMDECEKRCQTGGGGTYYRVSIFGDTHLIPCRIPRKIAPPRRQKKDALRTGFSIEPLGVEAFYGFTIDGDGRYLLDDFTVTHNSGKTVMGLHIAAWALSIGYSVVWMVPRDELIKQTIRTLWEAGCRDVACVRKGRIEGNPGAPIVLASIQTLVKWGFAPRAGERVLAILDEARHYTAPKWGAVAGQYKAAIVVGLDATPATPDGRPLGRECGGLFDHMIVAAGVGELQADGYLARDIHIAPELRDGTLAVDPVELLLTFEGRSAPWRGKRTIVYCSSRPLAARRATEISARGIRAEAVDGDTSDKDRERILNEFIDGRLPVLCNVLLFTEGLDVREIEAVLLDGGCSSEPAWIQKLGRGARIAAGKKSFWVLDPYGHWNRFGLFSDPREYSLTGEPIRRVEALPPAVLCKSCLGWRRGSVCACGAELPPPPLPRLRARELIEVNAAKPEAERLDVLRRMAAQERAAGRDPWRAVHRYRGSYGDISNAQAREVIGAM